MNATTPDTAILAALTQSIRFEKAEYNLSRARWSLLISKKHWKKVALYSSQLSKYDQGWRNAQAMTKEELDLKITNHQKRAIDFWLKYSHYKNL